MPDQMIFQSGNLCEISGTYAADIEATAKKRICLPA
jgi:hypothetical protein